MISSNIKKEVTMKRLFPLITLIAIFGLTFAPPSTVRAKDVAASQRFVVFEGFYNPT